MSDVRMNSEERKALIAELVKRTLPSLVLFARQWEHDSVDDIVQDAFIRLMNQSEMPQNPVAWLFTVIRNQSNNFVRSQKRRKNRESASIIARNSWFQAESKEQQLIHELESLPMEYREIIVSKIWGKLTFEQIGTMLESSRSSVHRKYNEGLAILKERLENHG